MRVGYRVAPAQMVLLVLLAFAARPAARLEAAEGADAGKELKALAGTWKTVAVEAMGAPFPKENIPDFTYIVAADGKSIGKYPQGEYQATTTVDPKASPKTIDILHETGAQQGKRQYGIYTLQGDRWTVCMTPPGAAAGDRPKDFDTKDATNVVFVFERQKDDQRP